MTVYLDKFSLLNAVALAYKLACLQGAWPRASVVYIEKCAATNVVVRLLKFLLPGMRWLQLEFASWEVTNSSGHNVREKVHYGDLFELRELLFGCSTPSLDPLTTYLQKEAVRHNPITDQNGGFKRVYFLQVVSWHARASNRNPVPYFVVQRPGHHAMAEFARRRGLQLVPLFRPFTPLADWTRQALSMLPWLFEVLDRMRSRGAGERLSNGRQFTLVAHSFGAPNFGHGGGYSDVFMVRAEPRLASRTVLAVTAATLRDDGKKLEAADIEYFSTSRYRRATSRLYAPAASRKDRLRCLLPFFDDVNALAHARAKYDFQLGNWRGAFEKAHARVFLTWFKYDASHIAATEAIRSLGGVSAVWQRSLDPAPTPETTVVADIMFGFSALFAGYEVRNASAVGWHVTTGYCADYVIEDCVEQARSIRTQLNSAGARRVLAYFDVTPATDRRIGLTREYVSRHHRFLIERILCEPDLGIVFKGKKGIRADLESLGSDASRAAASGRIFFCEELGPYVPPAMAALAADVVVQCPIVSQTAALESALAGRPTLLLDDLGLDFPSTGRLGRHVVYRDWQSLWTDLAAYWHKPDAFPEFGSWAGVLDELDPFRDGRAAERIGRYLGWLLEGYDDGIEKEAILARAAERYAEAWGNDKIRRLTH
jgi:hypothetical protein